MSPMRFGGSSVREDVAVVIRETTVSVLTKQGDLEKEKEKEKPEEDRKLECPICFEAMKPPAATSCGHVFCNSCIRSYVSTKHICPTCSKHLTIKDITTLYL